MYRRDLDAIDRHRARLASDRVVPSS